MLHENHPLPPALRKKNQRAQERLRALPRKPHGGGERARHAKRAVGPRAAAFALLGMLNWIYQWDKPEGALQAQNLVPQFTDSCLAEL